jgi:hypothetical protein
VSSWQSRRLSNNNYALVLPITMTIDKSIFGFPFMSSEKLQPARKQLAAFLESVRKGADNDLTLFLGLLKDIDAFEQKQLPEAGQEDIRKYLFHGALRYSQFADHALLSTVELFQYQMHALSSIDFDTPSSFIQAAEQTMRKLSRKKIDDVLRMVRLQEMIRERKKIIEKRRQPWEELAAELCRIALYIKDNLVKIGKECETSIIMLSDLSVTGEKERLLIEGMKTHFKDQARRALHSGTGTIQDIQNFLQEANLLVDEVSIAAREDINALTGLYEALHDHLKKTVQVIENLLTEIERRKGKNPEENGPLFVKLEQALVSLLSVHRLEQQATGIHTETAHEKLVTRKRKEMLSSLFDIVQKDRRARTDRRSSGGRRKFNPDYHRPERRSSTDRRSGKNRRELCGAL